MSDLTSNESNTVITISEDTTQQSDDEKSATTTTTTDSSSTSKSSSKEKPSEKPKPTGPAAGGFFEMHLPENWGTIRLWAEQQQVKENGYDHYVLRFNDQSQPVEEPKPLEGNQIVKEHFDQQKDIKQTNAVTVCSGNVEQTLEPLQRPQPKETVKIRWNEYSFDPFPETTTGKIEKPPSQQVEQQQSSGQFDEMLQRRG